MKKIILAVILMSFAGMAKAVEVTDSLEINGLAYDSTYDFHAGNDYSNRIGAIVTYTSTTFATQTFTDGHTSSGTMTVTSTVALSGQYITLNGYKFCAGVAYVACAKSPTTSFFAVGATVDATATNLAAAINGHAVLGSLIAATASTADVTLLSEKCDGVAYTLSTSGSKITVGGNMGGGIAATVFDATSKITIASHGYQTGLKVALSGATLPGGLSATDYYIYKVDANTVMLSSTAAKAIAADTIDIGAVAIGATAHTMTLTPADITGTPSFKWQTSNDSVSWADMAVTSVTLSAYTAGGTSSIWDFSWFPYKWLRLKVVAPTTGGIYLKSNLSVKR